MLLRFCAKNHLSLRDPQELSLVSSSLKDTEAGLIPFRGPKDAKALPVAVIYGANAAGKSNVVDAIEYMRSAVLLSHREGTPGGGVPRAPFALDEACLKEPSSFDADFIVDGTRYHYGFSVRNDAFAGEWLHAFPSGKRQTLFERSHQDFDFGRSLKGRNRVIADLTRPNSLFVAAGAQNDHEELSKVSKFFRSIVIYSGSDVPSSIVDPSSDLSRVVAFLSEIGTGVDGYRFTESELSGDALEAITAIRSVFKKRDPNVMMPDKFHVVQLSHRSVQGEKVFLDFENESTGTRRLLRLLQPALQVLDTGGVLIVDEIDASLHTKACEAIIALFSSKEKNRAGAQLIATTHDTNLLRSPLLRRDQIWFTEKGPNQATHLYPLSDFHTRQGDNIEKGYLQGRYGAIPFAGSPSDLLENV